MLKKFSDVLLIKDSDGSQVIYESPKLNIPEYIKKDIVTTADGTIATTEEVVGIIDNGWNSTSLSYVYNSLKYLGISGSYDGADYPNIKSVYNTTTHLVTDLNKASGATTGSPIFSYTNNYKCGVTALTIVGEEYKFTLSINAEARFLEVGDRLFINNPDQTLNINNGLAFIIQSVRDNEVICIKSPLYDDYSAITPANISKLAVGFRGREDLPIELLYVNITPTASSTTNLMIYS